MTDATLGVYVHIPFCTGKCPYCDFNSRPGVAGEMDPYVEALVREMEARLADGPAVDSVYFGGGTPTILAPDRLVRLLEAVRARARLTPDAEITIETNPESTTPAALATLRAAGFNRLSIGVQSFDDRVLSALGRRHDAARARQALAAARATGWDNISLDLMFAAPGQTARQWAATLAEAVAHAPQHLSTYCLTIEPGTAFHRQSTDGRWAEAGEEAELAMAAAARHALRAAGYEHYEISNFALPGRRCRHNERYWRAGDYLGVGAGAHSCLDGLRWANITDSARYGALLRECRLPVAYVERLSAARRRDEQLMLALRTSDGVNLDTLVAGSGRDETNQHRNKLQELAQAGLAVADGSHIALTERGMALASEVAVILMDSAGGKQVAQ